MPAGWLMSWALGKKDKRKRDLNGMPTVRPPKKSNIVAGVAWQKLCDAGLLPDNCRRVIIDMEIEETCKIYYECYGDERRLDLVIPGLGVANTKIISTKDMLKSKEKE